MKKYPKYKKELANKVYDTLVGNTQYPQINPKTIKECEIFQNAHQEKVTYFGKLYPFLDEVTARIKRTMGIYVHENMIDADIHTYGVGDDNIQNLFLELEELLTEVAREESKKIYKELEKHYENLTTEDSIADTLEQNEYEFTENGDIFIQK